MAKISLLFFVVAFAQLILLASSWGGGDECNQELIQVLDINNGQAVLNQSILDFLRDPVRAGKKLITIMVVGTSRSGKSFFLDTLTKCPNKFEIGHELTAQTKGAVAFPVTYIDETTNEEHVVLLIDSEGLGRKENDKLILLFAALASSGVVYHLDGKIEAKDISRLDDVTRLYKALEDKHIHTRFAFTKPIWVIDKVTLYDKEILKRQEEALSVKDNCVNTQQQVLRTATVDRIRDTEFAEHPPFYLHAARKNVDEWMKIDQFTRDELDAEYLSLMDEIEVEIKKTPFKRVIKTSDPLTCNEYANFLEAIMDTVNNQNDDYDLHGLIKFIVERAVGEGEQEYKSRKAKIEIP